jgi:hypothetical protein
MFSQESLVSMGNGTLKPIYLIQKGDIILNKFKLPVSVLKVNTYENQSCVRIQFNNGTNTFHSSPNSIVFCYYRLPNHTLKSEYCNISDVHDHNGYLKSNLKLFSPESDIYIDSYIDNNNKCTLYSLQTSDNSQSYFVNKAIVSNIPSHY